MTIDAVGGVWQYAMALARELSLAGDTVLLAGLGPKPTAEQKATAEAVAPLAWLKTPPDWLAGSEADMAGFVDELSNLLRDYSIDLVQLNEPGQASEHTFPCPVVAVSHSCIGTWFRMVHNSRPPSDWAWRFERTRKGLKRADLVVAPSESHIASLRACYGASVVPVAVRNAVEPIGASARRENIVFAAGRWWDDGKNAAVLDQAAARTGWPVFAAGSTAGPTGQAVSFTNVNGLGPLAHSEARALATRSGIFISPSLYEPFGLAALEAATAGTPLILADIPTYRELWANAAVFFPPRDAGALTDVINQLAQDTQLRRSLGEAARRRSRSYTLKRQAASMRRAYETADSVYAGRV
jgi:glycosyltransferase involved in cell wall biosynthesis